MELVLWILLIVACGGIALVRNNLVYDARMRAIDMVGSAAVKGGYLTAWEVYHSYGTYDNFMLDVRKWSFEKFYPGIEKRLAAITGEPNA